MCSSMSKPIAALLVACATLIPATASAAATDFYWSGWGTVLGKFAELAGRDLNGTALNGDALDGRLVDHVSFDGVTKSGTAMAAVWLEGSRFQGIDAKGKKKKHAWFEGAIFEATLDDQSTLPLYVAAVERYPEQPLRDVWGYELWYPTAGGWHPLCGEDADGEPLLAIPLDGRWNHEQGVAGGGSRISDDESFTFACAGYVLAKCVLAGYEPWRAALSCAPGEGCYETTLAAHHQACTRALRADYFGDGTPHTHDGVLINVYDSWGIRSDDDAWPVEAEWDEDGAICVAHSRVADATIIPFLSDACGGFDAGTLLVTELEQPW
jgi:ADYC domain-containing protein